MTVSDPGAGQQQGREAPCPECGVSAGERCENSAGRQLLRRHGGRARAARPAPSPTPPARDSDVARCDCGRAIPCRHCDEQDSGRDEAREAVALRLEAALPGVIDDARALAGELLALPELDKLLRRPA